MKLGQAIDRVRKNIQRLGQERQALCYNASEALYLLAGGKKAGLKAMRVEEPCCWHWYIQGPWGEIIDLTAGQFRELPNYAEGKGAAFYPNRANLTKELMK